MANVRDVALFVGSLRRESFSRRVAVALTTLAPATLALRLVDIGDIPFYNQDLETGDPPPEWSGLRRRVRAADAVLFVTPEYNRSVPAVLKNAIDVASRPFAQSAWEGKPAGIVSVSPGAIGAFGANHHLRQSLVFLNMPAMPQPEAYVGGAAKLFDERGTLVNEGTRDFLQAYMTAFAAWVELALRPA
jgi:chromate reductase